MHPLSRLVAALLVSVSLVEAAIVAGAPTQIKSAPINGTGASTGCLTAASNTDGAKVTVSGCIFSANQQWTFPSGAPVGGASAPQIIQIFGNKCLDVTNGVDASGTKLQIFTCAPKNTNQQWVVNSNATFTTIQWANHGRCVDNTGGIQTGNNPTQIWSCIDGNNNQKWIPSFDGVVLPAGTPRQFSHGIDGVSLTVNNPTNNAIVTIAPSNQNIHTNTWVFNGGTISINGGTQCLDVTNGADVDGTLLQVFQCTKGNTNQQWKLLGNSSIQWAGHDKCIDLTNGNTATGTQVQLWSCFNNNANQKWIETPVFLQ